MTSAQALDDVQRRTGAEPAPVRALTIGTRLRDYEITGLIGEEGFGIVYLAWDHSLQRKVAVKEYMPASLASRTIGSPGVAVRSERHLDAFKAGLKSFVNEARLLARFDHPSLVKVYRFWEENGTAYMVMPFYEGPTLADALAQLGHVPSEAELRAWLAPVLNAIAVLHAGEIWHQHIGADSILLTPVGPVLLGFASAEHAVAAAHHTPAAAIKPGFAAIEQYGSPTETTRGAWTDLYALAAVVYAAITGAEPQAAADRLAEDRVQPLQAIAAGLYGSGFLGAIDAAMAVEPERRPRDHLAFRALMGDIDAPEPVSLAPRRDLMQEPFIGGRPGAVEITVPDHPVLVPAPSDKPAAAEARPKARPANEGAAQRPGGRAAPSWMGSAGAAFGKRALYGMFAMTLALIGLAALFLQFSSRQSGRPASPVATLPAPAPPAIAAAPVAPPDAQRTVPSGSALVATPAPAALATGTAPTPSAAALPTPAATGSTAPAALSPTAALAASSAVAPPSGGEPPAGTVDLRVRCTEILQKASLERITAAETEFFKRECK